MLAKDQAVEADGDHEDDDLKLCPEEGMDRCLNECHAQRQRHGALIMALYVTTSTAPAALAWDKSFSAEVMSLQVM